MFPEEEIGMAIWSIESLYLSKEQELLVELLSPEMYNLAVTFFLKKREKENPLSPVFTSLSEPF